MTDFLSVPDITCEGCANSIKNALGRIQGVNKVDVNVATKKVAVTYDEKKVDLSSIKEKIERIGYTVQE